MSLSPAFFFGISLLILVGLILFWLLWLTEGAYLGRWAVRRFYDLGATTYERVKSYDLHDEATYLGNPIASRLEDDFPPSPLLLDVATGTARLPRALFAVPFFTGEVVGLDLSRAMLAEASRLSGEVGSRLTLIHHPAVPLPFAEETFDGVSSLEALEFMPDRHAALQELYRVLRPGGWLVVSNRIGIDAALMPGRTDPPERMEETLAGLGLLRINTRPWQEYYDLIFARKGGARGAGGGFTGRWLQALRCPCCGCAGVLTDEAWNCRGCHAVVEIAPDGVWELEAIEGGESD